MSYFAIERNGEFREKILFVDDNGAAAFEDYLGMDYVDMKSSDNLEDFVYAVMDATKEFGGDQASIVLADDDGVFIWGIIIGYVDDVIRYVLVDWQKDGKKYRYED